MTVVRGRLLDASFAQDGKGNKDSGEPDPPFCEIKESIDKEAINLLFESIAVNSTAYESTSDDGTVTFVGSKTESTL